MTNGDKPPTEWASKEDQERFFMHRKKAQFIGMGSATFNASQQGIFEAAKKADNKRVVFSRDPKQYQQFLIPGRLEFEKLDIATFQKRYQHYKQMLLVSGKDIALQFFEAKLITKVEWTVEPVSFQTGIQLRSEEIPARLDLITETPLNRQGTILRTYEVQYSK